MWSLVHPVSKTSWPTHQHQSSLSARALVLLPRTCQFPWNLDLLCHSSSFLVFVALCSIHLPVHDVFPKSNIQHHLSARCAQTFHVIYPLRLHSPITYRKWLPYVHTRMHWLLLIHPIYRKQSPHIQNTANLFVCAEIVCFDKMTCCTVQPIWNIRLTDSTFFFSLMLK